MEIACLADLYSAFMAPRKPPSHSSCFKIGVLVAVAMSLVGPYLRNSLDHTVHYVIDDIEFPSTTSVTGFEIVALRIGNLTYSDRVIETRATGSALSPMLSRLNLGKNLWDVSSLFAAGGLCIFE